jgi:hypothetical protein
MNKKIKELIHKREELDGAYNKDQKDLVNYMLGWNNAIEEVLKLIKENEHKTN